MNKVIIIGSGPAGLTAGIYAARAGLEPLLISGLLPGGLLTQTGKVENYPGFPEGVDGVMLMSQMLEQAANAGVQIEYDETAEGRALTEDDVLIHEDLEDGYSEEDEDMLDDESDELFDDDDLEDDESIYDNDLANDNLDNDEDIIE